MTLAFDHTVILIFHKRGFNKKSVFMAYLTRDRNLEIWVKSPGVGGWVGSQVWVNLPK